VDLERVTSEDDSLGDDPLGISVEEASLSDEDGS